MILGTCLQVECTAHEVKVLVQKLMLKAEIKYMHQVLNGFDKGQIVMTRGLGKSKSAAFLVYSQSAVVNMYQALQFVDAQEE